MLYLLSYSCFNVEKWRKKEKIQFKYLIDLSDNKLEVLVVGCDHFLTKKKKNDTNQNRKLWAKRRDTTSRKQNNNRPKNLQFLRCGAREVSGSTK